MAFEPKPLDLSGIELTPELRRISELLAENTHNIWAKGRIADGWHYGPERNDARREHPCLVPYAELPESEKEYDRRTAMGAIQAIMALGYSVCPPAGAPATSASPVEDPSHALLETIQQAAQGDPVALHALWAGHQKDQWQTGPAPYTLLSDKFHRRGEPLLSYDVAAEGLLAFPENVRLRQLKARALARMGQNLAANDILQQLYDEKNRDDESLGLFASVQKDLAFLAPAGEQRSGYLAMSAYLYGKSFARTSSYWTGINAATLNLVQGKRGEAEAIARKVYDECRRLLSETDPDPGERYWLTVTLGEAALVLGRTGEARDWYTAGAQQGRTRFGDVLSTRRNLRLLAGAIGADAESILELFRLPHVVAFVGHLLDRPDRPAPRFPAHLEPAVRQALRERLGALHAGIGFSAAACGSDILFLEVLRELGGETHVVLPFCKEQFVEQSVSVVPGGGWEARFEAALKDAAETVYASGKMLTAGAASFEYVGQLLIGLAGLRAAQLETELIPLAVWDGNPGDGAGGTADTIAHWRGLGHTVEIIDLGSLLRRDSAGPPIHSVGTGTLLTPAPGAAAAPEVSTRICSLLFADAVGFSHLDEAEVPAFVEHFLGLVARVVAELPEPPLLMSTWGDGLYFVFAHARDAGVYALELCDRIKATRWPDKGLRPMNLRIGLHTGPVYCGMDPVTRTKNYFGTHVSQAARIEPVTRPGHAYASQAFAALAAAHRVTEFRCLYVGQTKLAKDYGTRPIYLLTRT
ncbi:MAG TPA: RyR domain-containing protein [Candidatus Acidoferrales bacterium]|nr:RyR domain-containing protein [Candidatus Acidoferrales bacterium]